MRDEPVRPAPLIAIGIALVLAGVIALRGRGGERTTSPARPRPATSTPSVPGAPTPATTPERSRPEGRPPAPDAPAEIAFEPDVWATIDLEAVRAIIPENTYWRMSAPTNDPALLREREEERERWNVEYGKVLSNTATAEEVEAYYAHRRRLSSDYIVFATHLLSRYGDRLPPRDLGLLKLAIQLHLARLEEIPRQIAEAHQRREAHEAARRAWLADQKAFEAGPP